MWDLAHLAWVRFLCWSHVTMFPILFPLLTYDRLIIFGVNLPFAHSRLGADFKTFWVFRILDTIVHSGSL